MNAQSDKHAIMYSKKWWIDLWVSILCRLITFIIYHSTKSSHKNQHVHQQRVCFACRGKKGYDAQRVANELFSSANKVDFERKKPKGHVSIGQCLCLLIGLRISAGVLLPGSLSTCPSCHFIVQFSCKCCYYFFLYWLLPLCLGECFILFSVFFFRSIQKCSV